MAVNTEERKWKEEPAYKQLKVVVTSGTHTFVYTVDDRKGQVLPTIAPFTRIKVDVDYATADKGIVSVRGKVVNA